MKLPQRGLILGGCGVLALVLALVFPQEGELGFFRQLLMVLAILLFLLMAREWLLDSQGEAKFRRDILKVVAWQKLSPSSGICVVEVVDRVLVIGYTKEQIQLLYAVPVEGEKKDREDA